MRIPKRFASVQSGHHLWISLGTDSMAEASAKAPLVWAQKLAEWEAKLLGDTTEAEARYQAACDLAKARGFRYLPAAKVAELPLDELLARVEAVGERPGKLDMAEAKALLGGVKEPPITVSRALDIYWSLTRDRLIGKSADQVRRWKNPRVKAVKNFIAVVGDKALAEISAEDTINFRSWWAERLQDEDLTPNSANKDFGHLSEVLKTVNKLKRLELRLPLSDLKFKEADAQPRPPFSDEWISDRLLADGALDRLNPEARAILLVMVNTGCRPSEIAALTPKQIMLDHKVPHIAIEADGRQLKSSHARRVIPLAGVSLEAMRAHPDGFPRYGANSASLSATVNKYLRENGLLETDKHTLYSLRHAFEDRMLAAGVDERIRCDVFGHRLSRERYGKGATLEMVQAIVQRIAF